MVSVMVMRYWISVHRLLEEVQTKVWRRDEKSNRKMSIVVKDCAVVKVVMPEV